MTDREQVNKAKWRSWQLCRSPNQMPAENCINVELPKQIPWLPSLYRDNTPSDFDGFSALGFTCRWFIAVHNARLACLTAIFAMVVDGAPCERDTPAGTDDLHTWEIHYSRWITAYSGWKPKPLITATVFSHCTNTVKAQIKPRLIFAENKVGNVCLIGLSRLAFCLHNTKGVMSAGAQSSTCPFFLFLKQTHSSTWRVTSTPAVVLMSSQGHFGCSLPSLEM